MISLPLDIQEENDQKSVFLMGKGPQIEKAFWLVDANSLKQARGGESSDGETQGRRVRWCRFFRSRKDQVEGSSSESLFPEAGEWFGNLSLSGNVIATSEGQSNG